MTDYISLEAAIKAAMQDTGFNRSHEFNAGCARAANNLKAIPAADVAPVVRCRECRYYEIAQLRKDGEDDHRYKPSVCVRGKYAEHRKPEWYCADGKRREDEKDGPVD